MGARDGGRSTWAEHVAGQLRDPALIREPKSRRVPFHLIQQMPPQMQPGILKGKRATAEKLEISQGKSKERKIIRREIYKRF